ncbi:unnamed protein product [Heligmosomoides polygyrus]|uniref:Peptidase A2 domain-containing protein n=1 Tax=Heligmosomoides polygyrus TaxID=6339 RepID=A0A183GQD5_HELPZ|nr:unnamed protein product [Heligmosomoides polygyrus]
MLDTGANGSFITYELDEGLQLKDVDYRQLIVTTFGSHTPMRMVDGKKDGYYVRFPWKKNAEQLPDNKGCRLQTLTPKLIANIETLGQYQETINF